jgi:hypothetical protein
VLRVFESGVWRKMFGPKGKAEETRLHSEEINDLYYPPPAVVLVIK